MKKTGFVFHDDFLKHRTGEGHPERPARLDHLMERLERDSLSSELVRIAPIPADLTWIQAVHPENYIESIQKTCKSGLHYLDSDTVVCEDSYQVALLAAGGVCRACEAVQKGEVVNAFCAIRPPGHHAETGRAMGFCLFNNVAIAARYLQHHFGVRKLCIIDWDVHHGNGTQAIFYSDPSVFYVSIHQFPLYPGTGTAEETGEGEGKGTTLNLPSPAGSDDAYYRKLFEKKIVPAVMDFAPDFVLISAGFDAHRDDPLANMMVTERGFAEMTELTKQVAEECCEGRLVSVLEGGYNLEALATSAVEHVGVMAS
ncbi:MAG: histone deacetylase [Calditrichaeota bacterium]|nr:MAG: histone deacetylase [Calditrichota bacterium]